MTAFKDKVVMVTGAASGFGALLTAKLAARGAHVVAGDIDADGLARVTQDAGEQVVAMACDVSDEAQVKAMVDSAVEHFGRLDIGINNAGIAGKLKNFTDTTEAEMDLHFAVNTKGVFFGVKHQVPVMAAQGGGVILNVSSMAGLYGAPKFVPYAAAKHAVIGITKCAAIEYGRKNIRVNAVCPYFTMTPMVEGAIAPELQQVVSEANPMKRLGDPDEVVDTMLHIVHPDNTYLNGQAIAIDGGISAI